MPLISDQNAYRTIRRIGKRYLAIAVFAIVVLFHTIYWLSPRSKQPSATPIQQHVQATDYHLSISTSPSPTQSLESFAPAPTTTPAPATTPCGVVKVSMLYGAHKFAQLEAALDSHRRHSERWGCGFESLEQDLTDRKLYSKEYFLLSTMLHELSKPPEERQQWLMWVDADSILVNPAISPSAFLPPDSLQHVFALVTADHQGLNAGLFYLKVHPSSVDLLTQVVDYPLVHPDEDLGWFGEQAAMERVIRSVEAQLKSRGSPPGIAWVPRVWFNTYEFEHGFEGEPGHFIVHFAGLGATRITHMSEWLNELQQNQEKWEIPIQDTFYADAVPKYWEEFARNGSKDSIP